MTRNAEHAIATWQQAHRRRAARALTDRVADGLTALGGIVLANAVLSLGMGLPNGRIGALLGMALLVAGLAKIMGARRAKRPEPKPAWTATGSTYGVTRANATRAA